MSGYRSSDTEIGCPAAYLLAKSSRSSIWATVMIRVSRMTSAKLSVASHSLLRRTSVRSGIRIWSACSRYVSALRSISSSERIGRSVERPDGSPIRVV